MSRRRKKEKSNDSASGSWLTTFSDLMSLLLTFFILLFSMSSVSNEKFNMAATSLSNSLMPGSNGVLEGLIVPEKQDEEGLAEPAEPIDTSDLDPELLDMYNQVMLFVEKNQLEDKVSISADSNGIYVNVSNAILFGKESASISREGRDVLGSVAELLNQMGNNILIEGHTDNIPNAYGQYETNWELSTSRAVSVLRYLSEEEKVNPNRLSAVGYGEYQPLVPNTTPENRAHNRRVNIVVVYEPEE